MAKKKKVRKIFVLDTSVILHDHNSIKCFDEHDIAIPITVLEELDNFKGGTTLKILKRESLFEFLIELVKNLRCKSGYLLMVQKWVISRLSWKTMSLKMMR